MAKDTAHEVRLEDLTAEEIERIEAFVFCLGGPPEALTTRLMARACQGVEQPKLAA